MRVLIGNFKTPVAVRHSIPMTIKFLQNVVYFLFLNFLTTMAT